MPVNRRSLLTSALLAVTARRLPFPDWISPALAEASEKKWRHGMSLYGELKYPPGFKQFDYVNAKAPKGGAARQVALGTFDNFNAVVAGVKGALAAGTEWLNESLVASSLDEVSSAYGLLAEAMSYAEGYF